MKPMLHLLFLLVLSAAGVGHASTKSAVDPKSLPPTTRYWRCEKEEAEVSLMIGTKLDVISDHKQVVVYFRKAVDLSRISAPYVLSSNSDGVSKSGKGIGHGYSLFVAAVKTGAEIHLSLRWTLEEGEGSTDLEFVVPYMSDREGKVPGITYSCVWKKLK